MDGRRPSKRTISLKIGAIKCHSLAQLRCLQTTPILFWRNLSLCIDSASTLAPFIGKCVCFRNILLSLASSRLSVPCQSKLATPTPQLHEKNRGHERKDPR